MPSNLDETRIDTTLVYEGHFLKVRRDLALLPDGSQGVREYVQHPGAACIVPLFDDGRVLIERQFRYPLRQTFIEFPAGKLDIGELALDTAQRELLEETGYVAREWAFLTRIHPTIGFSDEILDIFLCRGLQVRRQALDVGEFLEIEVVTLGWLVDEVRAGRISDVKTQIAIHWLERIVEGRWPWPVFEVG
jgi:ADP-ribose pyrophosphatase